MARRCVVQVETTFTGFADRSDAGHWLARALAFYRHAPNAIVIGLPRGGVITAAAVAEDLDLPLDVLVVRKLGVPGHAELAMGAIGPGDIRFLNHDVVWAYRINPAEIEAATARERVELEHRQHVYRGNDGPLDLRRRTVIVVDDGLATGSTMTTAIGVIRQKNPERIVLAVPIAPVETCEHLRPLVDELVYLETPEPFQSVGYWYVDFGEVNDEEVTRALDRARSHACAAV
jgi:putative phosphoribosyl transferase